MVTKRRDSSQPPITLDDDASLQREYHPTLVTEIRDAGGQWYGSDYWAAPADIIARAIEVGATAMRVSLRDPSALRDVPGLWHLAIASDGTPALEAVTELKGLSSLTLSVRGIRGTFEPGLLPALRWFTTPLGGKGGAPVLESLKTGHDAIEHLRVRETKVRSVGEVVANLPRLQSFSVAYADFIGSPGDLAPVADTLTELRMVMVPGLRSLDGIEAAVNLERLTLQASKVTDLRPLSGLTSLREVDLVVGNGLRVTDVNDLR